MVRRFTHKGATWTSQFCEGLPPTCNKVEPKCGNG
ncbi:hypothetical protein [Escherichia phage CLB_P2]|nr:hypothetical protein [Escherichia phage CLB_P2]